jgi:hypothetical protein
MRGQITDRRMDTDTVVLQFNVLVNRIIRLFTGFELGMVDELFLNDAVKSLDTRVSSPRESHP